MRKNIALEKSLKKLGEDIKTARLRRRQPRSFIADRSGVSIGTITKIEEGEAGVSIGNVAAVLWALGLGSPFSSIAEPKEDQLANLLERESLPKRGRMSKAP
jgi:transcriptional regulator with XRE-family HTH domain